MRQRKSAASRKADIVAALLRQADRIGPDRLTTNDIAREVGVTQAAIFRHFPTKADLWSATGDVLAARLEAAWAEALAENVTPRARLRGLIGAQLRQIEAMPALPNILRSRELNVDNAELRDCFRDLMLRYQGCLLDNLQALADEGGLKSDLPPQDAAILLISLVQGIAIRWNLRARSFGLEAEGLRLFDIQIGLFAASQPAPDRGRPGTA